MGQERKFSCSRLQESYLPSSPCPRLAVWSQEAMAAQPLQNIAAEAGLGVTHPKSCLVPEQVLVATVSSFHQELLTPWSPLDVWVKRGFLLQKVSPAQFPWSAGGGPAPCLGSARLGRQQAEEPFCTCDTRPRRPHTCTTALGRKRLRVASLTSAFKGFRQSGLGVPRLGTFCCGCRLWAEGDGDSLLAGTGQ